MIKLTPKVSQVKKTTCHLPYKVFIIAGESSGDNLGAAILSYLRVQLNEQIIIKGIGDNALKQLGVDSLFPITDLAVMGIFELIPHLPKILVRIYQTIIAINQFKPDVVLTIDAPGFNFRIAKKLKKLGIPVIHITAPTVWAWKPTRAKKVAKFLNHLLCLFKFEPPYFMKEGLQSTFIGHPLIEKKLDRFDPMPLLIKHHLKQDDPKLVVLPGSRISELDQHLELFISVAQKLKRKFPNLILFFPTLNHHESRIKDALARAKLNGIISYNENERISMMRAATVALAASGTVTLELALCHTPMVVGYKVHPLTAAIVKRMLKTSYISLVNILYGKKIVSEFLQQACTEINLKAELEKFLMHSSSHAKKQLKYLVKIDQFLKPDDKLPSEKAGDEIIKKLVMIRKLNDNK